MLAGSRQRRRGPSSSVLKHSTAGDHISNIFSLIVSYFVAFPPFQPPLCGSAQLSHCWNLPNAWVPAAQQFAWQCQPSPMPSTAAASPACRTPRWRPQQHSDTATSSPYPPYFHHCMDRPPASTSICQLLRPTELSDMGHFSTTQSVPQPFRKHF